jgi:glycine cleavage system protein P-like pyridoxal-binding family
MSELVIKIDLSDSIQVKQINQVSVTGFSSKKSQDSSKNQKQRVKEGRKITKHQEHKYYSYFNRLRSRESFNKSLEDAIVGFHPECTMKYTKGKLRETLLRAILDEWQSGSLDSTFLEHLGEIKQEESKRVS